MSQKPKRTREPSQAELDHCDGARRLWNEAREAFEATPIENSAERYRRFRVSERLRGLYYDCVDALYLEAVARGN